MIPVPRTLIQEARDLLRSADDAEGWVAYGLLADKLDALLAEPEYWRRSDSGLVVYRIDPDGAIYFRWSDTPDRWGLCIRANRDDIRRGTPVSQQEIDQLP